jgi:hypothetical protein
MSAAPQFALSPSWRRVAVAMAATGLLAAAAGVYVAPQRTWSNLLLGEVYLLFIALSGVLFLCFHYLSGAGWSAALRRVPEAMMAGLPTFALLLALAVFFGRHALYSWSHSGPAEPLAPDKAAYLSTPFVLIRMAIVLYLWALLARVLRAASLRQDQAPAQAEHQRLVKYAAIFVVVFAISFSLASVDWLMSLNPHWSSTIFAVYVFAGVVVLGIAVVTLIVILLRERGPLAAIVNDSHLHDLGKLLFAFTTFWAYIWLSQYLLIWYGNLPEEVTHYLHRTDPAWLRLFLLNLVVNWAIPFVVLLPRAAKRSPRVLKWVCGLLLFGRWLDLYLIIMPETLGTPSLGPLEVLIPLGCAGLFLHVTAQALAEAPLVPLNDPYLEESLHHHT